MSNWSFDPLKIAELHNPGVAFTYGDGLYYLGTYGSHKRAFMAGMSTANVQADATLPVPSANLWSQALLEGPGNNSIVTDAGVAAAVLELAVCAFWQDTSQGVMAVGLTAENLKLPLGSGLAAQTQYVLKNAAGNPLTPVIGDVAATGIDSTRLLVATLLGSNVYIGLFDYAAALKAAGSGGNNKTFTWEALTDWTISLSQLQNLGGAPSAVGRNLSLEWYSVNSVSGTEFWLALSLFDGRNSTAYVYWLPLDLISIPRITVGYWATEAQTVEGSFRSFTASTPIYLTRDMAARLRLYWGTNSNGWVLNTVVQPAGPPDPGSLTVSSNTPQYNNGTFGSIPLPPAAAYVQSATSQNVNVNNDPDTPQLVTTNVSAFPAGEIVFASDGDNLMVFSQQYGMLQSVSFTGTSPAAEVLAVRGIIDGPIPVPNVNTQNSALTPDTTCAQLIYGTEEGKGKSTSWSLAMTFGVKINDVITKGIGIADSISFDAGFGLGHGRSSASEMLDDLKMPAKLDETLSIIQQGLLYVYGVHLQCSLFRFLEPLSDGSGYQVAAAPEFAQLTPSYNDGDSQGVAFTPYDVTPGDITSYTRENWNKRMQDLGYPSPTYFEDVIVPNAMTLNVGGQPLAYLECMWGVDYNNDPQFGRNYSGYTDASWIFDASVYVGFSVGEEFSVFGLGEGAQGTYLAGTNLSTTGQKQSQKSGDWGLSVELDGIPPPPTNTTTPPGVLSYTFRVYFLPSSDRWREEFLQYQPDSPIQIDPNSKPWRIVYEVTDYALQDKTVYPLALGATPPAPLPPVFQTWGADWFAQSFFIQDQVVQYAVSFTCGEIETQPDPGNAAQWFLTNVGSSLCPEFTLPTDTTNWATGRRVYRVRSGKLMEMVGVVPDNTTLTWEDKNPQWNFPAAAVPTLDVWSARSNYPGSQVWVPGNTVQYAVTYVFSDGSETQALNWTAPLTVDYYAMPTFKDIPVFVAQLGMPSFSPPLDCIGLNLYRQCAGSFVQGPALVGTATLPPPGSTFNIADNTP